MGDTEPHAFLNQLEAIYLGQTTNSNEPTPAQVDRAIHEGSSGPEKMKAKQRRAQQRENTALEKTQALLRNGPAERPGKHNKNGTIVPIGGRRRLG